MIISLFQLKCLTNSVLSIDQHLNFQGFKPKKQIQKDYLANTTSRGTLEEIARESEEIDLYLGLKYGSTKFDVNDKESTEYGHNYKDLQVADGEKMRYYTMGRFFVLTQGSVFEDVFLREVTRVVMLSRSKFSQVADIYNGSRIKSDSLDPDILLNTFTVWNISRRLPGIGFLMKRISLTNRHQNVEALCSEVLQDLLDTFRVWVKHKCNEVGCKARVAICDGNFKNKRKICAAPGDKIIPTDKARFNFYKKCIKNPVRGDRSIFCEDHSSKDGKPKEGETIEQQDLRPETRRWAKEMEDRGLLPTVEDLTEIGDADGCRKPENVNKVIENKHGLTSAGILIWVWPCLIRLHLSEIYHAESLTQWATSMIDTFTVNPDPEDIKYVCGDRVCEFCPFCEKKAAAGNEVLQKYLDILDGFPLDKFHGDRHVKPQLLQMENEDIAAKKAQFQKEKEAEALRQDMIEFEFMGLNEDFVDSEAQTSLDTTPQKAANEAEKTPKKSSKRASKKASGSSSISSVDEDFVDSEAQTSPDTTPQKTANEAEKIPKKSSKGASKKASGSTSIGSVEKENKSKKPSYFLEQLYRNIMQGGTAPGLLATMYHAKEKDFFLNFDEASMFFDLLFTSGGGIQGAKRTEFCTYLLSFFTSRESRSMKVSTGPLVVQDASLQIFGACQPQIIIDAFLKDPRDPAGLFDRFSYCYNRRVNIPLRKQKQNVDNLERVNLDIKKLLRTVESLHAPVISEDVTLTHHQWFFDEDALELVFQFDELLSLHDNGDPTLMAMNAKGRMKMYSGAAINACKRQALEMIMLEGDSESLSKMDQRKIITKEDVLKAIYLTFQSNFIFLQLNATTVDPGSRPLKQKQKSGGLSGGVGRNKPGGKGGAFVVDLEDYERDITDVSKAYEKVYKIYKVAEKVDDDANDQAISFDALLDERAFIRAPSNSNFSEKECLVFFLRFLEYNGIGRLLMNGTIDAKDRTTFSNKEYCNMTFVLHKEDKLNDEAKQFLNRMVVVMRKKDPQFSPFADK